MYICPNCSKPFMREEQMVKHLTVCWKEQHSNYKSTPAPRSADIETKEINNDIFNFFNEVSNNAGNSN